MLATASPLLLLQRRTLALTLRASGSGYKITSITSTRAYSASLLVPTLHPSYSSSSPPSSVSSPLFPHRRPLYPLPTSTTIARRSLSSSSSSTTPAKGQDEEGGTLIYEGGHRDVIRTLKRVSLTTCIIGLFSTPFFLTLGSEAVPLVSLIGDFWG